MAETRITHIVSGHLHKPDVGYLKEKNKDGESDMQVRVGSTFIGMPGWEKMQQPVGYAVSIKKGEDGKEQVTVEELQIPDYAKDMVAVE